MSALSWKLHFKDIRRKTMEKILDTVLSYGLTFGKNILVALVIYFVGRKLIKWVLRLLNRPLEKGKVDPMVVKFINSIVNIMLHAVMLVGVVSVLGVPTATFVTLFGTVSLTVGLALQGSLSNFAGGVLILLFKPFHVGDYIIACGSEGTVTGIDVFYTKLTTGDNRIVVIPNGTLANASLTNVTSEKIRRVDIKVGVSYDSDIRRVKEVLNGVLAGKEAVIGDKGIQIFVSSLDESQITMETRVWVNASDYWPVKWQLLEEFKLALDDNGIEIPFNQLSVTVKNQS